MQVPDYVFNPAAGTPQRAQVLQAVAITLGETMIAILQPATLTALNADTGSIISHDFVETALHNRGSRPLTETSDLTGPPDTRWHATLTGSDLTITTPDDADLYSGTLNASPTWRAAAAATCRTRGGIVVLTGPMSTTADITNTLASGRASWIRVPLRMR
ncbi:hypothetical protein [Nocardia asiatica]|uniref:hypothetical protein n=1 Tax=Nocardia asiatica TaxID=209252 RepID=UPI0002E44D95|nr:hypothetical protein [Nocardia asiatica]